MYYFNRFIVLIAVLLSIYFITKGINIDLDETKHNQIVLNFYSQIKIMHFSIAFALVVKATINLVVKNIVLRKILAFNLLIDLVCLFFIERATSYFATGSIMNPMVANVIIGVPLLIILLNQIYYIYLWAIKRKRLHWKVGLEEILDTNDS
jgi:hypothetical protein